MCSHLVDLQVQSAAMDIIAFREYCLGKAGVIEEMPFDDKILAFKVGGKIFALTNIELFESINLKCDPEQAVLLREKYPRSVTPGYHMNKKHWNTLLIQAELTDKELVQWIDHSYLLVCATLPKKVKEAIGIGQ